MKTFSKDRFPLFIVGIFLSILLLPLPLYSALDMFLKIDTIPGDSVDDKHKDWIEILSYSHGASVAFSDTERRISETNFDHLALTKLLDKTTPQFMLHTASGQHIQEAIFALARSTGDREEFYRLTLSDVIVAAISQGGAPAAGSMPLDEIALNYGSLKWEFFIPDGKGGTTGGGGGTSCSAVFASDIDVDCDVDGLDLAGFAKAFMSQGASADLNEDGKWDQLDLEIFATDFGKP